MQMLDQLKLRLSIKTEDEDELLLSLLEQSKSFILAYTMRGNDKWLKIFDGIQLKIAAIEYNRLGKEGTQSAALGNISDTFYDSGRDYPDQCRQLKRKSIQKQVSIFMHNAN